MQFNMPVITTIFQQGVFGSGTFYAYFSATRLYIERDITKPYALDRIYNISKGHILKLLVVSDEIVAITVIDKMKFYQEVEKIKEEREKQDHDFSECAKSDEPCKEND